MNLNVDIVIDGHFKIAKCLMEILLFISHQEFILVESNIYLLVTTFWYWLVLKIHQLIEIEHQLKSIMNPMVLILLNSYYNSKNITIFSKQWMFLGYKYRFVLWVISNMNIHFESVCENKVIQVLNLYLNLLSKILSEKAYWISSWQLEVTEVLNLWLQLFSKKAT